MYLKWSDNKKFKSNLISEHKGDEAGIKFTIKIERLRFGWLKKSGIHRLVRISPFDLELDDTQVLQVFGFIQL